MTAPHSTRLDRRRFLGVAAAGVAAPGLATPALTAGFQQPQAAKDRPTLVGSANALPGMQQVWKRFTAGGDVTDAIIDVVKVAEANPADHSVGLGGLPDESGHVTLDSAVMHGPTHNSGAVACIENIQHPSEVARLVMERTDHCLIVGPGAYRFARDHGHPHTELLTDDARAIWLAWRERMSDRDDRLPPAAKDRKGGQIYDVHGEKVALEDLIGDKRITGTIHCSGLSVRGEVACTTTTSGLSFKIPGRVGDSPIIGAGLYCDQEAGSAGGTGRGESAILSNASFAIVELMRQGAAPLDAGLEVLRRVARQAKRASSWQPGLVDDAGRPAFGLKLYVLGLDGTTAGVSLRGGGVYSVADVEKGPRHAELVPLFE
jgi:N4-(beta-N-acetylglucosaminyl)-L-asparaginase